MPPPRVPRIDGRIPSLDGLRALSISLVLLGHLAGTRNFPSIPELGNWQLGNLGVRVFFVISGFLITTLLLEESDRTGTVSLRQFYLRRCFRIFPAFYVFCAVLFILEQADVISLRPGDLISAVTYTINYHHDRAWYTGHLWSLSVEEQFYLIWPAILLFAGVRGGLWVAALAMLIAPPLRLVMGFWPALRPGIGETFPSVADALATGCVLAGLRPWLSRFPAWNKLVESPPVLARPARGGGERAQPVGQAGLAGRADGDERGHRRDHRESCPHAGSPATGPGSGRYVQVDPRQDHPAAESPGRNLEPSAVGVHRNAELFAVPCGSRCSSTPGQFRFAELSIEPAPRRARGARVLLRGGATLPAATRATGAPPNRARQARRASQRRLTSCRLKLGPVPSTGMDATRISVQRLVALGVAVQSQQAGAVPDRGDQADPVERQCRARWPRDPTNAC